MKTYLFSFDFSEVSVNALRYLLDFSTVEDKIDIIHVEPTLLSLTGESALSINFPEIIQEWKQKIATYLDQQLGKNSWCRQCDIYVEGGEIARSILSTSAIGKYDMIVMGTRDKYSLLDKWLGTISHQVVRRSTIPVLLIPPGCSYAPIHHILVAGDLHLASHNNLVKLRDWNKTYNAHLHIVHIREKCEDHFDMATEAIITQFFEEEEVNFPFDIRIIEAKDVEGQLLQEAERINADMIIVFPEEKPYVVSIFSKSTSKQLILHSKIPCLFLK